LKALPTEIRTHVKIDANKGTGEDGMLFGTENLVFADWPHPDAPEVAIMAAVANAPGKATFDGLTFLPLGGERRIATVRTGKTVNLDPLTLPTTFDWNSVQGIRVLLVTPALFANGWYPDWLTGAKGPLAGFELVSAATGRPNTISGWDLQGGSMNATRSAVPAGSVYFFRLKDNPEPGPERTKTLRETFENLRMEQWLKPVSDEEKDRRDGYGLMLPGVW
jgi:CRISPR-associated protein Cmr3